MAESDTYVVSDGRISIPSDALLGGEDYQLRYAGDGSYYLAHVPKRDEDGSRRLLILEEGYAALQRFCHEMGRVMGHRPEYTLALSGLMVWTLEQERQAVARSLVQAYGESLYRGDKHGRPEGARFIRLFSDATAALNQFASGMSEVLGGMTPERTIVLTALAQWAVAQDEAPDVVDEYGLQMYAMRRKERQKERARMRDEQGEESPDDVIVTEA